MKYLTRKNIDDQKWDECILKSPNGLVYGLTNFLDGLTEEWNGLVWESQEGYSAVFPIPVRKKLGLKYVYPPFFIQQLGLFSVSDDYVIQEKEAINFLISKFRFVELNLNYMSGYGDLKRNLTLCLKEEYDQIKNYFSSNHKRNIKKADNSDLELRDANVDDVIALFKLDKGTSLSTYKELDYQRFSKHVNSSLEKRIAFVKGVYHKGELICGGVFFSFKNRIIFLFSGNSEKGKEFGALFYLLNSMIKNYAKSGFVLDFEGSENEGLSRFYAGFGAVSQDYRFYKHNNLPRLIKKFKK